MFTSTTVPCRLFSSLNSRVRSPLRAARSSKSTRCFLMPTFGDQFPHSLFHTSTVHCRGNSKPTSDAVVKFFARFPDFKYDSNSAWPGEWKKLCQQLEEQLQRAAIERFHATYSFDPSDLAAWQKMCRVLGIVPAQTLEGCREVSKLVYIRENL